MPNANGGFATTNAFASYCDSFSAGLTQANEYTATAEGQMAFNICGACQGKVDGGGGYTVIGYTDGYGNPLYHYDCGELASVNPLYRKVQRSITAYGCSGTTVSYYDCEYIKSSGSSEYCDNDYYWDSGHNCVECPRPAQNWTWYEEEGDNKTYLWDETLGGHACGYGTIESDSEGITSCVIAQGKNCTYCDNIGCFKLSQDCHYSE